MKKYISTSNTGSSNNHQKIKPITITLEQNPKNKKDTTLGIKFIGMLNLKIGLTNTGLYVDSLPIIGDFSTSSGIKFNLAERKIGYDLSYTKQGKYFDTTYSENFSITKTGILAIIFTIFGVPIPTPSSPILSPVPAFSY